MKVICKQRNSRMCVVCGLDNPIGLKAPFYTMEDGSVISRFTFSENFQSYPGRVHGGIITAVLDELGLRAMWSKHFSEDDFGVTMSLTTDFRKPVLYDVPLLTRGMLVKENRRLAVVEAELFDATGTLLANATLNYLKMDTQKISVGADVHEEMPYLIEDGVTEISI